MKVEIKSFDYYVEDNTLVVKVKAYYDPTWYSPFLDPTRVELWRGEELVAVSYWSPPSPIGTAREVTHEVKTTAKPGTYVVYHKRVPWGRPYWVADWSTVFKLTQADIGIKGTFTASFTRTDDTGTLTVEVKTNVTVDEDTKVTITVEHETWAEPQEYVTYVPKGSDYVKWEQTYSKLELPDGEVTVEVRIGEYLAGKKTYSISWESGSMNLIREEDKGLIEKLTGLFSSLGMLILLGLIAYFMFKFVFPLVGKLTERG